MGQSAEELRREIEQSRENLTGTVDAIGDRVSPGRIVERKTNRARQGLRSMKDTVMGTASDAVGTAGDRVSGVAGAAATSAASGASQATDRLKDAPQTAKEFAARKTQGAPLAAGLIAFGAGALVAALVKGSETEGQVAQAVLGAAQPIKDAAAEAGQELSSGLKEQGQQAFEQVKESAAEATQQVKDQAQQATEQTVETGRDATQQVRDQAQQGTGQVAEQASTSAQAVRDQAQS